MSNPNPYHSSHTCPAHPDRAGIVTTRSGTTPCWECYLGHEEFMKRFGKDFYAPDTA